MDWGYPPSTCDLSRLDDLPSLSSFGARSAPTRPGVRQECSNSARNAPGVLPPGSECSRSAPTRPGVLPLGSECSRSARACAGVFCEILMYNMSLFIRICVLSFFKCRKNRRLPDLYFIKKQAGTPREHSRPGGSTPGSLRYSLSTLWRTPGGLRARWEHSGPSGSTPGALRAESEHSGRTPGRVGALRAV